MRKTDMAQYPEELKVLIAKDYFTARQRLTSAICTKNVPYVVMWRLMGQKVHEIIETTYGEQKPYQIVFLDGTMPGITGINVLKHFRTQSQFAQTLFAMVTALSLQARVLEDITSGATVLYDQARVIDVGQQKSRAVFGSSSATSVAARCELINPKENPF